MPRPPLPENERLTERIYCRFNKDEYEHLKNASLAAGLSISDLIRRRLFGLKIPNLTQQKTLTELHLIRNLLSKHGGLFKNLYNLNPIYSKETAAALAEQVKMYGSIENLIQYVEQKVYGRESRE